MGRTFVTTKPIRVKFQALSEADSDRIKHFSNLTNSYWMRREEAKHKECFSPELASGSIVIAHRYSKVESIKAA